MIKTKKILAVLLVSVCMMLPLFSCQDNSGDPNTGGVQTPPSEHTIILNERNGKPVSYRVVARNAKLAKPTDPVKEGATFQKWCLDESGYAEWDFDDPVRSDLTLYAIYGEGFKFKQTSGMQPIYSDAAKYNASREQDIKSMLASAVQAKYLGESIATSITNYHNFVLDPVSKEFPVGDHKVTFQATTQGASETYDLEFEVLDGAQNKIYIEAKQYFGGDYNYFKNNKIIGINPNNYFRLNSDNITDYTATNVGARGKSGLSKNLLTANYTLKEFVDPILIHNKSGTDVYYKPTNQESTYAVFDANGMLVEGYEGSQTYSMVDADHPIIGSSNLSGAASVFLSDRLLPDGGFVLVINDNGNRTGNYYIDGTSISTSTYDYDGRKYARSNLIYRYGNVVKIYVGKTTPALLTTEYTNQSPYIRSGELEYVYYTGGDKAAAVNALLNNAVFYDDDNGFAPDVIVPAERISLDASALDTLTSGIYTVVYTVEDNSDPAKNLTFSRKVNVQALTKNYSSFQTATGEKSVFFHNNPTTGASTVNYNTQYTHVNGDYSVFVFDQNATSYFASYNTAVCQWSVLIILDSEDNILYSISAMGAVTDNTGASVGTIAASGNMFANFLNLVEGTSVAQQSNATTKAYLSANGGRKLIVYPNTGGSNFSRKFGDEVVLAHIANPSLRLTIVGENISVGL